MKVLVKSWFGRDVSWNFLGGGSNRFPFDPNAGLLAGKTELVLPKLAKGFDTAHVRFQRSKACYLYLVLYCCESLIPAYRIWKIT